MKKITQKLGVIIFYAIIAILLYIGFFNNNSLLYCQIHHMGVGQTILTLFFLAATVGITWWQFYSNTVHANPKKNQPGPEPLKIFGFAIPDAPNEYGGLILFGTWVLGVIAFLIMYTGHNDVCAPFMP